MSRCYLLQHASPHYQYGASPNSLIDPHYPIHISYPSILFVLYTKWGMWTFFLTLLLLILSSGTIALFKRCSCDGYGREQGLSEIKNNRKEEKGTTCLRDYDIRVLVYNIETTKLWEMRLNCARRRWKEHINNFGKSLRQRPKSFSGVIYNNITLIS